MEENSESHDLKNFKSIFSYYQSLYSSDPTDYTAKRRMLRLPKIPIPILVSILTKASDIFQSEPAVLDVSSPCVVVGDLHGQILDLFRILRRCKTPPQTKYVFLGDLVDRGQFSTETVTLVFLMKVIWPDSVYIIRGNHEFTEICSACGFNTELMNFYNDYLIVTLFESVFSYMPLGAIIDKSGICLHGGIGPSCKRIGDLECERPLHVFPNGAVTDVLWSDPSEYVRGFHPSARGSGHLFGTDSLKTFLADNDLSYLIRGHQCVAGGCSYQLGNQCITVFSASNYCGVTGNKAGVLWVKQGNVLEPDLFDPLPLLKRSEVFFAESQNENVFSLNSLPPPLPPTEIINDEKTEHYTSRLPQIPKFIPNEYIQETHNSGRATYKSKHYESPKPKPIRARKSSLELAALLNMPAKGRFEAQQRISTPKRHSSLK